MSHGKVKVSSLNMDEASILLRQDYNEYSYCKVTFL